MPLRRRGHWQTAGVERCWELVERDAEVLEGRLGRHEVAVVLGTGWAPHLDRLGEPAARCPLEALSGVPAPSVPGHGGDAVSLGIDGRGALVLTGRSHLYEGHSAATVVHAVRCAITCGARVVILTNAAGSLRVEAGPGTAVLIRDQLNLTGTSPLIGPEPPGGPGNRFVDLSDLYSRRLRAAARAQLGDVREGVYAGLVGPQFETPAEIDALDRLGADLVGMSTVLEAIAARHLGAEVAGVSLVTNLAAGLTDSIDHHEVLAAGSGADEGVVDVIRALVAAA